MADSGPATVEEASVQSALAEPFDEVDFASLPATPHDTFRAWLRDALARGVQDPHAMTLSTVDAQGRPDARVVALRKLDDARGWHFSTSAASAKAQQLAAHQDVALTFFWPRIGRQVRLRGCAAVVPDEADSAADFAAKPYWSQVATLGSGPRQSQVLDDPQQLRRSLAEARARLDAKAGANPGYILAAVDIWRLFSVQPETVEFWQDAPDRIHRRLQYVRTDDKTWIKRELWP